MIRTIGRNYLYRIVSAHPRSFLGTVECPIHKGGFFSLGKAAQGFAARRTLCAPQPETRYDRPPNGKKTIYGWKLLSAPLLIAILPTVKQLLSSPSTVSLRALIGFRSRKRHFLQVQGNQRHSAEGGGSVRCTSDSADWRRNCGKGPFIDGNYFE
jgi:hypothetical protein